ncbi:DMT family transporter [Psychrobacter sp. TAE2020]|uniref:DMT family transporter n=1 Tax=Psychrobacter sp. TAE2020 TaxID=2846762 RepID=UPI001C119353|nr:DMT family transporter [Psychrobacter sp. TAE2020]MBU5616080.1 DMT family transporter [Psychrobacter sp. TAE2020]
MKNSAQGWLSGFIGVVIFAGSLPATRLAVMGLDPAFLTSARAAIAALLGGAVLLLLKQPMPTKADLPSLAIVTFGVVIGFPLLSALALQYVTSAHAILFLGVLPLFTAIFAVWRGGERPPLLFWLFALLGSSFIAGYAAISRAHSSLLGGLLMLGAVIVCGLGYAEGARLSRTLGGWQVISWALVLSLPIMLPIIYLTWPDSLAEVSVTAWAGLMYVSIFSMFIGFVFWYRGLALGGIAAVGQLQLLQPFMGLTLAALLLHETVSVGMLVSTLGAIICVIGAKKYAV